MNSNYTHLIYGDGAGKTTACVGAAIRAFGAGRRVLFCSFLKDGTSGEIAPLAMLGVEVRCVGNGKFFSAMSESEREQQREATARFWRYAAVDCERFDTVILDEAVDAVNLGLIELDGLLELVEARKCELYISGHNPEQKLVEACDYVSEVVCRAHPYEKGVTARRGVEY